MFRILQLFSKIMSQLQLGKIKEETKARRIHKTVTGNHYCPTKNTTQQLYNDTGNLNL